MLSKKTSMVPMVTDEFLENHRILQKYVATIGFIWLFWFQKCILLYIFVQVFLVMRCIRSHISFFRLGLTPTLNGLDMAWLMLMQMQQYIQHCMDLQLAVDPYKRRVLFESMDWLPKTH